MNFPTLIWSRLPLVDYNPRLNMTPESERTKSILKSERSSARNNRPLPCDTLPNSVFNSLKIGMRSVWQVDEFKACQITCSDSSIITTPSRQFSAWKRAWLGRTNCPRKAGRRQSRFRRPNLGNIIQTKVLTYGDQLHAMPKNQHCPRAIASLTTLSRS